MRQVLKFLLVGASNSCVSLAVFSIAIRLLPATPVMTGLSQVVSYACGIVWSFAFNSTWVFRGQQGAPETFMRFMASQVALMFLSAAAMAGADRATQLRPEVIWVIVMGTITVLNFTVLKKWVFKTASI
jgi:putative flippase GtrA